MHSASTAGVPAAWRRSAPPPILIRGDGRRGATTGADGERGAGGATGAIAITIYTGPAFIGLATALSPRRHIVAEAGFPTTVSNVRTWG